MIFVVNNVFFSSFVSNVFSDVIKRILGVFDDETEELKEEEEAMTTRKDDRSKCINIVVLRLIRFNKKSSSVSSFVILSSCCSSSLAFVESRYFFTWNKLKKQQFRKNHPIIITFTIFLF